MEILLVEVEVSVQPDGRNGLITPSREMIILPAAATDKVDGKISLFIFSEFRKQEARHSGKFSLTTGIVFNRPEVPQAVWNEML